LSIGIKSSKYEVMLLTDADCTPASDLWIQKMQDAYRDGVEIVLGYGAYKKQKGFLNKLVRFETFHTALQYLSYALAGMPYMGVGRNLSYRKELFYRVKGFSSINHIPGGDDDMFINKVSTKKNTAIVVDKDAFTLSESPKAFTNGGVRKRGITAPPAIINKVTSFYWGYMRFSHFMIYPLFVLSLIFFDWRLALGVFLVPSFSRVLYA
jgi:hypothetical protein